jgi:hypothetical protein
MGTFTVIEYNGAGVQVGGQVVPVPMEPALVEQTAITTSGTSQQSAAFNAATELVCVQTTSIVRYKFGTNPTASATVSSRLPAGQEKTHAVPKGQSFKVAVIDAT